MRRQIVSCIGSILVLVTPAMASKERVLTWHTFRVESAGVGESGPVVVSGTQTSRGIASLRVDAFGKSFELKPDDIGKLEGLIANNLQLSYEGGYTEHGGRTLYLLIATGFTSGVQNAKLLTVSESGPIEIKNRQ